MNDKEYTYDIGKYTIGVDENARCLDLLIKEHQELKKQFDKNRKLEDNWNKLKEFIVKEYYMYLPLEANTKSITILIDKMQEIEQGSDSNVKD